MLITFEGIDCCGKTTQIELLANYLLEKSQNVVTLREPGGTELAEQIRKILLNEKNHVSAITELILFEAARSDLIINVIKPALDNNKIVLIDRFYDSTIAYQGYGRDLSLEIIDIINKFASQNIIPDLTFYLDIPLEISIERSGGKKLDRMELAGHIFFENVIKGFRALAKQEPERIIQIDGTKSINEIFRIINEKVNSKS